VLNNFGWGEIAVILVIGLFVFGPERLPRVIGDAVRMVRHLRAQATSVTNDLRAEIEPHLDLDEWRRLDPRAMADLDEPVPARSRGSRAGSPAPSRPQPLRSGEVPPYDPDAT